jgi:hypothetical protein
MGKLTVEEVHELSKYIKVDTLKNINKKFSIENIDKAVYEVYMGVKNNTLTKEQIEQKIDKLTPQQVDTLESLYNPYSQVISSKKEKYYAYSMTHVSDTFQRNLLMTSLIGMLFRYVDELENVDQVPPEKWEAIKKERRRFLIEFFKYNPDFHVKSAYHVNENDPEREKLSKLDGVSKNKAIYNVIPAADMFYRWERYLSGNYEELRLATMALYPEKPDLEEAIIIYDDFPSKEDAVKFVERNQNKIIPHIKVVKHNFWSFTGPFKHNRKQLQLYGDQTSFIFKSIIDRHISDEKLGADMVKKKIKIKKRQNRKTAGPITPKFDEFRAENPNAFEQLGRSQTTQEDEDEKTVGDSIDTYHVDKDPTDDTDLPSDAVRVDILQIDAMSGKTENYVMYTEEVLNKPQE